MTDNCTDKRRLPLRPAVALGGALIVTAVVVFNHWRIWRQIPFNKALWRRAGAADSSTERYSMKNDLLGLLDRRKDLSMAEALELLGKPDDHLRFGYSLKPDRRYLRYHLGTNNMLLGRTPWFLQLEFDLDGKQLLEVRVLKMRRL